MARRQFVTKDGTVVSFQASGKKKKGKKRKLSEYNKFASPRLKKLIAGGMEPTQAMKQVGKEWRALPHVGDRVRATGRKPTSTKKGPANVGSILSRLLGQTTSKKTKKSKKGKSKKLDLDAILTRTLG